MIPVKSGKKDVQAVNRAFRIVECVQARDGASLSELSSEFDLSKSTILRHLNTLQKHGYVVKENGTYYVGMRFLDLGIHARNRRWEYRIIEPKVTQLADETGERAQFITEENGLGFHVYSKVGTNGIKSESRVGKMVYLHTTSVGKAVLASLPESRVEKILDLHGLPELTENTITSREAFFEELAAIRERGYAVNRAERRNGMMAVGVAVESPSGEVLGGLSVTGPARRMETEHMDTLPDRLLDVTEEINLRLVYPQQ